METTSNGSSWTLKNWKGYVYDAWNLIMTVRFETNGAVRGRVASYVWGPDIASRAVGGAGSNWQAAGGVGGLLFVVDGSSVSAQYPASNEDAADDNFFPLMDRLGNVLAYAKVANATTPLPLRAVYDYDAFGRELRSSGSAADLVPFHFSTKFTDQESGLNYYGYRYYDPGKGRWLNRDRIGELGGNNIYLMIRNSPILFVDRLGLEGCEIKLRCGDVLPGGPQHCGVVVNGAEYGMGGDSGIPDRPNGKGRGDGATIFGPGGGIAPTYINPDDQNSDSDKTIYKVTCKECCDTVSTCFRKFMKNITPLPYAAASGPNSNTYAHAMMNSCGCRIAPFPFGRGRAMTTTPPLALNWDHPAVHSPDYQYPFDPTADE